jgi:hypothetical protein
VALLNAEGEHRGERLFQINPPLIDLAQMDEQI